MLFEIKKIYDKFNRNNFWNNRISYKFLSPCCRKSNVGVFLVSGLLVTILPSILKSENEHGPVL